ncbi:hypothetical protein [Zoogloea sp. LCSB751]|uniref:hypothetical protein n=1 Tax=Zoogloea sp. LCSB751 TaxID=1965277 RepID=UPI0009A4AE82|nr:hypothetical protein [Zoogloea sp. LCSB751]
MNDDEFSEPSANDVFGHSGTAFDTMRIFSFEEAARALVHDITGKYVPPLENALTPLGAVYIDWKNRLEDAAQDTDPRFALHYTKYSDDQRFYIQRDHLRDWCLRHDMTPKFLNPKQASTFPVTFELAVPGYELTNELQVMIEAIKQFWVNADRSKPPKGDGEIIPWVRERVDSDKKAEAIDLLIRPKWARAGGNKKQSKG